MKKKQKRTSARGGKQKTARQHAAALLERAAKIQEIAADEARNVSDNGSPCAMKHNTRTIAAAINSAFTAFPPK